MITEQKHWTEGVGWRSISTKGIENKAQIVFLFGDRIFLNDDERLMEVKAFYPQAHVIGCSTSGEIVDTNVYDHSISATAIFFEDTPLAFSQATMTDTTDAVKAGEALAEGLPAEGLAHVLVLSEGLSVNGSALAQGLRGRLPKGVSVTGGLAGDQDRFAETLVLLDGHRDKNTIVAIGFYGEAIKIGYGSEGGWDSFGIDRLVTRSQGNVLYELDGQPALDLYKTYLGPHADGLPATGLLFPLSICVPEAEERLVRTILAVDEAKGSMTFAGDIPNGAYVRLMKANFERLVEGAAESARHCQVMGDPNPQLVLCISCVGRKLILKQRIDEEIESVRSVFGEQPTLTGFYSYGEVCPMGPMDKQAELHNQTMTITTFCER